MKMLSGYKTYIACVTAILWALAGYWNGTHDWNVMQQMIEVALIGAGLRHGMPAK